MVLVIMKYDEKAGKHHRRKYAGQYPQKNTGQEVSAQYGSNKQKK
jgi:hypothetical protein